MVTEARVQSVELLVTLKREKGDPTAALLNLLFRRGVITQEHLKDDNKGRETRRVVLKDCDYLGNVIRGEKYLKGIGDQRRQDLVEFLVNAGVRI